MTALERVRIGCVSYLNAKPLLHGWRGPVVLDHPARLAADLAAGRLDVALVPAFELLAHPGYRVVDGVSISSRGPVFSVFLAYRGALADVREISLDPASLTSANLLRVLLAEFQGLRPEFVSHEAPARLLIGNQALAFRRAHGEEIKYFDLGEEWTRATGLPFVYALWLIRRGVPDAAGVADSLRQLKASGLAHIPEIVAAEREWDATFRDRYLREHIRYDFGPEEKRGLEFYRELLVRHGRIDPTRAPLECV